MDSESSCDSGLSVPNGGDRGSTSVPNGGLPNGGTGTSVPNGGSSEELQCLMVGQKMYSGLMVGQELQCLMVGQELQCLMVGQELQCLMVGQELMY